MNARAIVGKAGSACKKTGRGVVNIAGKTANYASGISKLVWKDVKKIPGIMSKMPSIVSKAVRSKIEINIIVPEAKAKPATKVRTKKKIKTINA